jgi:hypothetical protein
MQSTFIIAYILIIYTAFQIRAAPIPTYFKFIHKSIFHDGLSLKAFMGIQTTEMANRMK